jgi:hypothetical protein
LQCVVSLYNKNTLFYFPIRSGIDCWWCSLGSFRWPGQLAYSWNSANGFRVPVKRTLFWESSLPCWRFSSRFSQRSGHILTRRRDRFSIGSIGWSETPPIYSPVSSLSPTRFNILFLISSKIFVSHTFDRVFFSRLQS